MNTLIPLLKSVFLHKRMKSLYWRVGGMAASELAFVVPAVMADYSAPQWAIVFFGLVLGEITKHLNSSK